MYFHPGGDILKAVHVLLINPLLRDYMYFVPFCMFA